MNLARILHEVNRALCHYLGDPAPSDWDNFKFQDSTLKGIEFLVNNPNAEPKDCHTAWCQYKIDNGWTYGTTKDEEKKTHPNLVPWEDLSTDQRLKDTLFHTIVRNSMIHDIGFHVDHSGNLTTCKIIFEIAERFLIHKEDSYYFQYKEQVFKDYKDAHKRAVQIINSNLKENMSKLEILSK